MYFARPLDRAPGRTNVMRATYFLVLCYVALTTAENHTKVQIENPNVNDIGNSLITFLRISDFGDKNERLEELRAKLVKIDSFRIDNERFADVLLNETKQTDLNQTNFYDALNEVDHFQKVADKEKSLILSLKEKMNRDDVLKILAEKGENKKVMSSARRMMNEDYVPKHSKEMEIEDVVDKLIAESPQDHHNFSSKDRYNKYWDPQKELEELNEHHQHNARRIFKGERTTVRYYPFMASIHVMGRFWCGGVIYWHDLVLTSAACLQLMHNNRFFRENPRILAVRMGSNHSRVGGEMIDALEVFFHPGYNPRTLRNNIAVIRLRRHLKFTAKRIPKIIDIAHNTMGIPSTAEVLVLGWGVTKTSQKMAYEPIYLQRKFLPVYPNIFCKEIYGDKFITQSMFCAGTFSTGEGACDHDAGGPAILGGRLVGIISFGPTICGYPNVPTVFTLVGAFADWIETINETMPEYYRGNKLTTTTTRFPYSNYFTRPTVTQRESIQVVADTGDSPVTIPKIGEVTSNVGALGDMAFGAGAPDTTRPTTPKPTTTTTPTCVTYGTTSAEEVVTTPVVNIEGSSPQKAFRASIAATKQIDTESDDASETVDAEGAAQDDKPEKESNKAETRALNADAEEEGFDLEK